MLEAELAAFKKPTPELDELLNAYADAIFKYRTSDFPAQIAFDHFAAIRAAFNAKDAEIERLKDDLSRRKADMA